MGKSFPKFRNWIRQERWETIMILKFLASENYQEVLTLRGYRKKQQELRGSEIWFMIGNNLIQLTVQVLIFILKILVTFCYDIKMPMEITSTYFFWPYTIFLAKNTSNTKHGIIFSHKEWPKIKRSTPENSKILIYLLYIVNGWGFRFG